MNDLSPRAAQLAAAFAGEQPADLGERLLALLHAARAAYPTVRLDGERFARHLARHRPEGAPLEAWLAELRADDLYLACAALAGAPAALELLDRRHLSQVGMFLSGMRVPRAFVEDVAQALRERLLVGPAPRLAEYAGRGALGSWLRVITVRLALDMKRKRGEELAAEGDTGAPHLADARPDPEAELLQRRHLEAVNAALRAAVGALTADQRRLLRAHFVEGATLDALAQRHAVHRATLARWIAAARREILAGARGRLAEQGLPPEELESLVGALRSRLHLSLSTALPVE